MPGNKKKSVLRSENIAAASVLTVLFSLLLFFLFNIETTGDSGDSITHYLISHYAFKHPYLFLDHWGKPFFTLISSPFAYMGFKGIMFFNLLTALLTSFLVYKIAAKFNFKFRIWGPVILLSSPLYLIQIYSGLTEHFFGFILISSVYLIIIQKNIASALLISMLPFVRSEGLIIIPVFILFFFLEKKYRIIPLLFAGHIIYMVAGWIAFNQPLWVFTSIPYAGQSGAYGSGDFFHFFNQMTYVVGIPIYIMLITGLLLLLFEVVGNKGILDNRKMKCILLLVFGSLITYFFTHSVFWANGWFGSMGLKRVLIAVVPLIVIAVVYAVHNLTIRLSVYSRFMGKVIPAVVIAYIVVFPFTSNPAALNFNKDFSKSADQILADEVSKWIISRYPDYEKMNILYSHPYLSVSLGLDPFEKQHSHRLISLKNYHELTVNTIVIWDNWFSEVEDKISYDDFILINKSLPVKEFISKSEDKLFKFVVSVRHEQGVE